MLTQTLAPSSFYGCSRLKFMKTKTKMVPGANVGLWSEAPYMNGQKSGSP